MAQKDLKLNAVITISNTNTASTAEDEKVRVKENENKVVAFRYFRVNFVEKLAAGDSVVLTAASSEESAYYLALANDKIGLSVTVTPANE